MLERVVKTAPELALAHLDLGIIYVDADQQANAIREMKTAATLTPEDVNVRWRLGRLYKAAGMKDEAREEFDKAGRLHKTVNDDLLHRMGGGQTDQVGAVIRVSLE
jgi:Flp pilus assembly protein TadD